MKHQWVPYYRDIRGASGGHNCASIMPRDVRGGVVKVVEVPGGAGRGRISPFYEGGGGGGAGGCGMPVFGHWV